MLFDWITKLTKCFLLGVFGVKTNHIEFNFKAIVKLKPNLQVIHSYGSQYSALRSRHVLIQTFLGHLKNNLSPPFISSFYGLKTRFHTIVNFSSRLTPILRIGGATSQVRQRVICITLTCTCAKYCLTTVSRSKV